MKINGALCAIFIISFLLLSNPVINMAEQSYALVLRNEAGQVLLSRSLDPVTGFAIRYTHSVARTPVTDYFIPENGKIRLVKTEYQDFGAGLPHNPEAGQKMYMENGKLVIDGYQSRFNKIDVRVGRIARHRLIFFDRDKNILEEIPLSSLSLPGSAITFEVGNAIPANQ